MGKSITQIVLDQQRDGFATGAIQRQTVAFPCVSAPCNCRDNWTNLNKIHAQIRQDFAAAASDREALRQELKARCENVYAQLVEQQQQAIASYATSVGETRQATIGAIDAMADEKQRVDKFIADEAAERLRLDSWIDAAQKRFGGLDGELAAIRDRPTSESPTAAPKIDWWKIAGLAAGSGLAGGVPWWVYATMIAARNVRHRRKKTITSDPQSGGSGGAAQAPFPCDRNGNAAAATEGDPD